MSANDILTRLRAIPRYHPGSVELLDDFTLQAGDSVTVRHRNSSGAVENYTFPVFSQHIVWNGGAVTQLEATGNETRVDVPPLRKRDINDTFTAERMGYGAAKYAEKTAKGLRLEFWGATTDIYAVIDITGERLRSEFWAGATHLHSELMQTATNIYMAVYDYAMSASGSVDLSAYMLKTEFWAGETRLHSEIVQTATNIYLAAQDYTDGAIGRIDFSPYMLKSEFTAMDSRLHSEFVQTATSIYMSVYGEDGQGHFDFSAYMLKSEFSAAESTLHSEFMQTATSIYMAVYDYATSATGRIDLTAYMLKSEFWASDTALHSELMQTATSIYAAVYDYASTASGHIIMDAYMLKVEFEKADSKVWSQFSQTAEQISQKVGTDSVMSAIEQTSETIKIKASKIDIDGIIQQIIAVQGSVGNLTTGQTVADVLKTKVLDVTQGSGTATINYLNVGALTIGTGSTTYQMNLQDISMGTVETGAKVLVYPRNHGGINLQHSHSITCVEGTGTNAGKVTVTLGDAVTSTDSSRIDTFNMADTTWYSGRVSAFKSAVSTALASAGWNGATGKTTLISASLDSTNKLLNVQEATANITWPDNTSSAVSIGLPNLDLSTQLDSYVSARLYTPDAAYTSNGTYTPPTGYDGFATFTVSVDSGSGSGPSLNDIKAAVATALASAGWNDASGKKTRIVASLDATTKSLSVTHASTQITYPGDSTATTVPINLGNLDLSTQLDSYVSSRMTTKTITENGTYNPGSTYDGFSSVTVSVAGVAADLGSKTFTDNGTYLASAYSLDGWSEVTIAVPETTPNLTSLSVTTRGGNGRTYTPSASSGYDGYSEVYVDVPDPTIDDPQLSATPGTYSRMTSIPASATSSVTVYPCVKVDGGYVFSTGVSLDTSAVYLAGKADATPSLTTLNISTRSQNGKTYTPSSGYDGYSSVTVNVPDPTIGTPGLSATPSTVTSMTQLPSSATSSVTVYPYVSVDGTNKFSSGVTIDTSKVYQAGQNSVNPSISSVTAGTATNPSSHTYNLPLTVTLSPGGAKSTSVSFEATNSSYTAGSNYAVGSYTLTVAGHNTTWTPTGAYNGGIRYAVHKTLGLSLSNSEESSTPSSGITTVTSNGYYEAVASCGTSSISSGTNSITKYFRVNVPSPSVSNIYANSVSHREGTRSFDVNLHVALSDGGSDDRDVTIATSLTTSNKSGGQMDARLTLTSNNESAYRDFTIDYPSDGGISSVKLSTLAPGAYERSNYDEWFPSAGGYYLVTVTAVDGSKEYRKFHI